MAAQYSDKQQNRQTMIRQILFLLLISTTSLAFGQQGTDFVILRPTNDAAKPDTVFGQIIFPKNGVVTFAKILTTNGKKKFHPNKAIGFKYGDRYFASVPYTNGHVYAERLINGPIELCYYSTEIQNTKYQGGAAGGLLGGTAISLTSFYYVKSNKSQDYMSVPHSKKKLIEKIGFIFEDNDSVYKQLVDEDFKTWQIPELVRKYNDKQ